MKGGKIMEDEINHTDTQINPKQCDSEVIGILADVFKVAFNLGYQQALHDHITMSEGKKEEEK